MSNVTVETNQPAADVQPSVQPRKAKKTAKTAKPSKKMKATKKTGRQSGAKPVTKATEETTAGRNNKKAAVVAMMRRPKGATLAEIVSATGWQKHTVRGFVSLLGSKGGEKIESSKNASGERTYKIAAS